MKENIFKYGFFSSFILVTYLLITQIQNNSASSINANENVTEVNDSDCSGFGNSSCESVVKQDINKTPQWEVLSISHQGDGKFGVTYLAPSRAGGLKDYYAEYFTDCRCKITNVNSKNSPPL